MTAAAPLPSPADAFAWLPEHMRPAARRWSFGLRPHAEWRALPLFGSLWYSDGACAVDAGIATDVAPGRELEVVMGAVLDRDRWTLASPMALACGLYVRLGPAVVDARYVGLVEALRPGATWEAEGAERMVVARLRERPVALVMPVRPDAEATRV